jgi:hypothetical protein
MTGPRGVYITVPTAVMAPPTARRLPVVDGSRNCRGLTHRRPHTPSPACPHIPLPAITASVRRYAGTTPWPCRGRRPTPWRPAGLSFCRRFPFLLDPRCPSRSSHTVSICSSLRPWRPTRPGYTRDSFASVDRSLATHSEPTSRPPSCRPTSPFGRAAACQPDIPVKLIGVTSRPTPPTQAGTPSPSSSMRSADRSLGSGSCSPLYVFRTSAIAHCPLSLSIRPPVRLPASSTSSFPSRMTGNGLPGDRRPPAGHTSMIRS